MLTQQEEKTMKEAVRTVIVSIEARTLEGSEERSNAMYALQDLCDTVAMGMWQGASSETLVVDLREDLPVSQGGFVDDFADETDEADTSEA